MKRPAPHDGEGEKALLLLAGTAVFVLAWFWLASELTVWSTTGRWPDLRGDDVAGALAAARNHLGDPLEGWTGPTHPVEPTHPADQTAEPAQLAEPTQTPTHSAGPATGIVFYLWATASAVGPAVAGRRLVRGRRQGNRWARGPDLHDLAVRRAGGKGRLVLGRTSTKGRLLATEARHSVLVIGPTQSGKTTGLAIPAILEWKGPVVATSVKDDLASATWRWRASKGPCWVFDPTRAAALTECPPARWSPIDACDTWSTAQQVASWLVESTPGRSGMADAAFWYTTAAKHLAPLLLAAQRGGMTMADVVRWTNREDFDEPGLLLRAGGDDPAAVALAACAGRDDRIRSSVTTTLETVLAPFEDPVVAASTAGSDVDLRRLIQEEGTLYLCGPSHEQNRVQGLFATLVSAMVAQAIRLTAETATALDPPLLLVLDEAANIAPIRDLDTLASTGAGLGVQLVTVCQDLAQLAARYGAERSRTIANNHRAKLLLSGVSDLSTLDLISGLAGEHAVQEASTTHDLKAGGRSRSTVTVLRRLAPTDELRRVRPGEGVLVYGHLPPARLRLRPWYADARLRKRAGR